MSLLDEAIYGMKPSNFGIAALDTTAKELAKNSQSDKSKLGFTTFMLQRTAAEEHEEEQAAPSTDGELETFYKDIEVMNADQAAEYLFNAVKAGKVTSVENFKEILNAVFNARVGE